MSKSTAKVKGIYLVEQVRKGEVVDSRLEENLIPVEGQNHYLDVAVGAGTQIGTWYAIGFKDNAGAFTPDSTSTYADPKGVAAAGLELNAEVSDANRLAFVKNGAAASGSISNSDAPAEYTMTGTYSITGAGLVGGGAAATTKGDLAGGGTLISVIALSTALDLLIGDKLRVTVTLTIADDGV